MTKALDRFDVALLNLLQADGLSTAEELSRAVPLSPSAIARRIRRLRGEGLIAGDMCLLSPALVGDRLQAVVQVQLHEHAQQKGLAALRTRLAAAEEVQICLEVSGTFDLMLLVVTRGMAAFNAFADEVLAGSPAVRRYETSFVKKAVKTSLAIPLDEADAAH